MRWRAADPAPRRHRRVRAALHLLFVVEVLGIVGLVLNPSPAIPSSVVLRLSAFLSARDLPARVADPVVVESALNALLFVPAGMLALWLWPRLRWWGVTSLGFAVSAASELVQRVLLHDRSPSWADVVANTVGTAVGALLGLVVLVVVGRRWPLDSSDPGRVAGRVSVQGARGS